MKKNVIFLGLILIILFSGCTEEPTEQNGEQTEQNDSVKEDLKILFLERTSDYYFPEEYTMIKKTLQDQGHKIDSSPTVSSEKLTEYDVLIAIKQSDFTENEINVINEFVENGGGFLLSGLTTVDEEYQEPELAKFNYYAKFDYGSAMYGDSESGFIEDKENAHYKNAKAFVLSKDKLDETFSDGVNELAVSVALELTGKGKPLLQAMPSAYPSNATIMLYKESGKGRMVISSTNTPFRDGQINQYDNTRFAGNIVNWLGKSNKQFVEPELPEFKQRNFLSEEKNQALNWIITNIKDKPIAIWWDEGQFLKGLGGNPLLKEASEVSIRNSGNPFLHTKPLEDKAKEKELVKLYLTESSEEFKEIMNKYNSSYFFLARNVLEQSNSYATYLENKDLVGEYFGAIMECTKENEKYFCWANDLTSEQINDLPTKYISSPNTLITEKMPGFIYREEDNARLYLFNQTSNNTMATRLWFNDSTLSEEFETVFENSEVKIIKIK